MRGRGKLGQLNVGGKPSAQAGTALPRSRIRKRTWAAIAVTTLVCAAGIWGGKLAAEQVVPRRVVVRGCWLTDSQDILAGVGFDGTQSVAALRSAARQFDCQQARWLRGLRVSQDSLKTAMLTVRERNPLLRLKVNGDQYWLCDDGAAVTRDASQDSGPVFEAIEQLPAVEVQISTIEQLPDLTSSAVLAAALCEEVLPGNIKRITVASSGEIDLYDKDGLRIRLGEPELLAEKIGALPKALRICEQKEGSLTCLDARDPQVFYEKWDAPINK